MRLITILLSWFIISSAVAQCDVELTSVDWETGEVVVAIHNSNNCGEEEDGDMEYITQINLGVTNGVDTLNSYEFANHPLLSFLNFSPQHWGGSNFLDYAYSGDVLTFNLWDAQNANLGVPTTMENWMSWYNDETFCAGADIFIWQVNYSSGFTPYNVALQTPSTQTQVYPDLYPGNNWLPIDGVCPCDTVETTEYIYETDTVVSYDTIIEYLTDTVYITEVDTLIEYVQLPPDTVHEYIYLTDTLYIETVVYENIYVYETDTITEFVAETIYIDCETGEACDLSHPCDSTSVFAPNAVTPNGDGWNDTWQVIADGACWSQWETRIYNRWGGLVWISTSNMDEWDANVATGVYVYTIKAHSSINASLFEFNGTITVLY